MNNSLLPKFHKLSQESSTTFITPQQCALMFSQPGFEIPELAMKLLIRIITRQEVLFENYLPMVQFQVRQMIEAFMLVSGGNNKITFDQFLKAAELLNIQVNGNTLQQLAQKFAILNVLEFQGYMMILSVVTVSERVVKELDKQHQGYIRQDANSLSVLAMYFLPF